MHFTILEMCHVYQNLASHAFITILMISLLHSSKDARNILMLVNSNTDQISKEKKTVY